MISRSLLSLLIVLAQVGGALPHPDPPVAASGLLLAWDGPAYRLTPVLGDDGQTYTRVEVTGYEHSDTPGWPRLPTQGRLVALPPSGAFGLELIEVTYDTVRLDHPIEPAPAPAPLGRDADDQLQPGNWVFTRDAAAYTGDTPYPAQFATLGPDVWMRDQRLARLIFSPFRYHPELQTLDVVRRLRLRITWEGPTAMAEAPSPFNAVLSDVVLNPADLEAFRAPRSPGIPASATRPRPAQTNPTYKVLVATEGMYALDYAALATAGLPVGTLNPATLRLLHGGNEVATQWEGDSDVVFESDERLLFYARPQLTRYAGYDVYRLSWGGAYGARMTTRSGDPTALPAGTAWATALAEENAGYDSLYQGRDGDRWFWRQLKLPDLTNDTFDVPLQAPAAGTTGELTVWLQGFTSGASDPDHHVRFSVNGSYVGEAQWDGPIAYTATLSLPDGLLSAGTNAVGLNLPGDTGAFSEGAWVDAVAVNYGLGAVSDDLARFQGEHNPSAYTVGGFSSDDVRVYDVTDPATPLQVLDFAAAGGTVSVGDHGSTPAEYLLLTDGQIQAPLALVPAKSLNDPPGGADYLLITHPDFATALAPLAAQRAAQGLRVVIVDVEAIYDQFGDGRMDPTAIKAFLSHAYVNWPGDAPQYVVLVGDGTSDPRGYRPDSRPTYLPPYLADVDPWLGEVASDNLYADLTDDLLPDLRLGRLPVNTLTEVEAIVDKIISYENNPLPGDWNARLVFGADNPSSAGDHHADADSEFNTYATPAYGYQGTRVYLSETINQAHLYVSATQAQEALIAALNRGALLYTYFGHASWHQEAVLETDDYAPLFHQDHITRLNNLRRWPVVLHMTCFTGRFTHPSSDTLDESLLRADGAGAVAVWGASGAGIVTGHRMLHRSFYQAVFDGGQRELGAATHAAFGNLYATGLHYDLIATYHLFGDPALSLNLTVVDWPFSSYLPLIARRW